MSIVQSVVTWFISKRFKQIEQYWDNASSIQEKTLKNLLRSAQNTDFGKEHHFSQLKTIADFKKSVPIRTYETFKPYIDTLMNGKQNVLWPSTIKWFAKSSGTTSDKSKFIPISQEALKRCHYQAGRDTMAFYCRNHPNTKVFDGKGIIMGGSHEISELNKGMRYGDLSAVLLQNIPALGRYLTSIDLKIALMDEWEAKIQKLAEQYIDKDVSNISGVPTWTIVLIKKIFEISGKDRLDEVWPNFELYIHGGVSFEPYRTSFQKLIPSEKVNYVQTYNASEGFFAMQDQAKSDDMLLMLDYGIFFEFMPMGEVGKDDPQTIQLDEVDLDTNYALIISTNSGLWRYQIGDTIQFTSRNPYRMKVSGRTKHFLNAFGEEVIVDNSDRALSEACSKHNCRVVEYTVAPIFMTETQRGSHEWVIEFEQAPTDLEAFTKDLDQFLQNVNSDYEAKRYKSIALKIPTVHSVERNTFYAWLKSKGKLGGQHKIPRLSNNRKYLEEILGFHSQQRSDVGIK